MRQPDFVDMHIHTTASDGSFSPAQVVELARKAGLWGIAITDHDTVEGFPEALEAGRRMGIEVLAGIEISLQFVDNTHLLGYFPQGYTPAFREAIETLKRYREERIPKMLQRLAELNCPVSMEETLREAGDGLVGRPHIAKIMVRKGYAQSIQEAFDQYLASHAQAYIRKKKFTPEEALDLIRKNQGIPILAHPLTMDFDQNRLKEQIGLWKEMGLAGFEILYSDYNASQAARMTAIADELGMLKTGGSDFHGSSKPQITLGSGKEGNLRVPRAFFEAICNYKPV